MLRRLDKLHARAIAHQFLIDINDGAVRDASLDDDGAVSELEAKIVEGIEMKGKSWFRTTAPPGPISVMAIGWKTITSPCSSPRIETR